jgi:hypothetical protein
MIRKLTMKPKKATMMTLTSLERLMGRSSSSSYWRGVERRPGPRTSTRSISPSSPLRRAFCMMRVLLV